MPIYVYACPTCDVVVEVLQKFNSPSPRCTKCKTNMNKQPALTSFALKGSGWAKDNYGLKDG